MDIIELHAWMDGGSVTLICTNERNQNFKIVFVQNVSWKILDIQNLPGRIYLDDNLVDQRCDTEKLIMKGLENSGFKGLDTVEKVILTEKMQYINSQEYLTDATKVEIVITNRCYIFFPFSF